ncbi:MAG: ectoine/hydroxyectoine ABC transporter substrate-binding protein EhuB [Acidimicrobiia bacterium]
MARIPKMSPGQRAGSSVVNPETQRPADRGRWSRREFLRGCLLASGTLLVAPVVSACREPDASDTLAMARAQGFIKIGFADEAPYGYVTESGGLTGQAPEVARAVMERLGVPEVDGVLTPFGSLISDLEDRRFDLIAAGMFITPDRCQQVLFSDPDYCVEQAFLVIEGNPYGVSRYESISDLSDVRLGVVTGTVEVDQARDSGVSANQVTRFDNPADLLVAVQERRIDVAALTTISLANLAQTADMGGVEVTESFAHGDELGCGAFGFRPADQAFRDEFNRVLRQMRDDGDLTGIVDPFGFADASDASEGVSAEELCTP